MQNYPMHIACCLLRFVQDSLGTHNLGLHNATFCSKKRPKNASLGGHTHTHTHTHTQPAPWQLCWRSLSSAQLEFQTTSQARKVGTSFRGPRRVSVTHTQTHENTDPPRTHPPTHPPTSEKFASGKNRNYQRVWKLEAGFSPLTHTPGGGGGVGTRPRYLIVCLWRRLLASRHCPF